MCADWPNAASGNGDEGSLLESCQRRQQWLTKYSTAVATMQRRAAMVANTTAIESVELSAAGVEQLCQLVSDRSKLLWWIDGADVASVRAIVEIARHSDGTIHVGQSTGASIAKRVMINEGWMGTSLGEVATQADLVITVGDCALSEAPLLASRFLHRAPHQPPLAWWHISADERIGWQTPSSTSLLTEHLVWPREQWLDKLTQLQLELRDPHAAPPSPLAEAILRAQYAVWIWENSEFTSSIDELIISRLLTIARHRTQTARCSLLNLESQVGKLTAEETLLWLTGCSGSATWSGSKWHSPSRYVSYTVDEWQAEFDKIVVVRTIPTVSPLPKLPATAIVATLNELAAYETLPSLTLAIEPIGLEAAGHLVRGDRAVTLCVGNTGVCNPEPSKLPHAANLFAQVVQMLTTSRDLVAGVK